MTTDHPSDPKVMARHLRTALADRDVSISHGEALELVARQLGARDWNTLAASRPSLDGHAIPILRVFDEARALEFYVDYLDFRVDWRHEDKGHEPLYAQLSRGQARVHLSGHHEDASPGSGILIPVPDARALQQRLQAKEYAYANPGVEEVPWGRLVTVIDPFSNRLVFHEPNDSARSHREPAVEPRPEDAAAPIVQHVWVACSPAQAFEVFTGRIGEWWPNDAYSPGPISGVTIEPRVGSPVRMHKVDGEDYVFGEVLAWDPPRHYAQSFTLAQDEAYPSRLDVTFAAFKHGGGTRVTFAHGGWNPGNVARRSGFSEWDILLGRFAALANTVAGSLA